MTSVPASASPAPVEPAPRAPSPAEPGARRARRRPAGRPCPSCSSRCGSIRGRRSAPTSRRASRSGLVALPLAMAFAIASGLPPESGIYCAIVTGAIISAGGGSMVQIGGPTGAFVVVIAGIVAHARRGRPVHVHDDGRGDARPPRPHRDGQRDPLHPAPGGRRLHQRHRRHHRHDAAARVPRPDHDAHARRLRRPHGGDRPRAADDRCDDRGAERVHAAGADPLRDAEDPHPGHDRRARRRDRGGAHARPGGGDDRHALPRDPQRLAVVRRFPPSASTCCSASCRRRSRWRCSAASSR